MPRLRKILSIFTVPSALLCGFPSTSEAEISTIEIDLHYHIGSRFNYAIHAYERVDINGQLAVLWSVASPHANDYGETTLTEYFGGTTIASSLDKSFPPSPYGGGIPFAFKESFSGTTDYKGEFLTEVGSIADAYSSGTGGFWAYHLEFSDLAFSAPRHGDGTSDYSLSPAGEVSFLKSHLSGIYFDESWEIYDYAKSTEIAGYDWADYNATITGLKVNGVSAIPELSTWAMMILGFGGVGLQLHRRGSAA
jgi:hypothetical protein